MYLICLFNLLKSYFKWSLYLKKNPIEDSELVVFGLILWGSNQQPSEYRVTKAQFAVYTVSVVGFKDLFVSIREITLQNKPNFS